MHQAKVQAIQEMLPPGLLTQLDGTSGTIGIPEKTDNKVAELATAISKMDDDFARLDAESIKASTDFSALAMKKLQKGLESTDAKVAKLTDEQAVQSKLWKAHDGYNSKLLDLRNQHTELLQNSRRLTESRDTQRDQINALQAEQQTVANVAQRALDATGDFTKNMATFRDSVSEHVQSLWDEWHAYKSKGRGKDKGKAKWYLKD